MRGKIKNKKKENKSIKQWRILRSKSKKVSASLQWMKRQEKGSKEKRKEKSTRLCPLSVRLGHI